MHSGSGTCSERPRIDLTGVLATHRLDERPVRTGERGIEVEALVAVLDLLATKPDEALREIVRQAMKLTGSGSAGISLVEGEESECLIRWQTTTGVVGEDTAATMPRHGSPCGTVIDHRQPMLLTRPDRAYPMIAAAPYPVEETLMIPFEVDGQMRGSLWAVTHDRRKEYAADDRRKLQALAYLAPLALKARQAGAKTDLQAAHVRELIQRMPMIVWTATAAGEIDALSDAWFAYTGQNPRAGVSQWREAVSPRDIAMVQTAFSRAAKDGQPFEVPLRLRRHEDQADRWHLITAQPAHNATGQITFWLGTATDFHDMGDQLED